MKTYIKYILAIIIGAFGFLTLYLSASIIFDLGDMRVKQGDYVPFVIWSNFVCSFIYIAAAYGFIKNKTWTTKIMITSVLLLIITFISFLIYINSGGIHKPITAKALVFRISISAITTFIAYFTITKKKIINE